MSLTSNLHKPTFVPIAPYKSLRDVCNFKRGNPITAKNAKSGNIPVIGGGQTSAYCHNESNRCGSTVVVAGSGAFSGYVSYWNEPIFVSDAFTIEPKDKQLDTKFLYYYLNRIQAAIYRVQKGAGVPHVYPRSLHRFLIPLPPLEVQHEIVEILDKFTELEARKTQYSYYRLSSLKHVETHPKVKKTVLGNVCDVFSGYAFKSKLFNTKNKGLPLIRIRDINSDFSNTYYSGDYDNKFLVKNGDLLIGMDGDFKATRWRHGRALLNQQVCRIENISKTIHSTTSIIKYFSLSNVFKSKQRGLP